jgi:hypothetical protein
MGSAQGTKYLGRAPACLRRPRGHRAGSEEEAAMEEHFVWMTTR